MARSYFIYEVTPRCNLGCLYCYNVWKENKKYPCGELALEDIKRLFKKIFEDTLPKWIILTGGEPLVRNDIIDIASFFHSQKIRVGLISNGTLLDEKIINKLIENGVSYFEISLNSFDQKTYTTLSGKNLLKNTRQAILLVKKYKIPLTVAFTINKLNYTDIGEVIDLCYAFSVDSMVLNRFVPGGTGLKNKKELRISDQELNYTLKLADQKSARYGLPVNVTIPIEACEIDHKQYPHLNFGSCGCGKYKWAIDPLGNLRTCEQNPEILGSLFDKSFSELSNLEKVKTFRKNEAKSICNKCESYKNCGGGCRFLKKN